MRYFIRISFLSFLLISIFQLKAQSITVENLKSQIDSIAAAYIKDFRTGYFKYSLQNKNDSLKLRGATDRKNLFERLKKFSKHEKIDFTDFELLPSESLNGKYYGLVTLSVINIRKQPKHSSELVSQALLGAPLKVLMNKNGWFLIQTPDEYLGWTDESAIHLLTRKQMDDWRGAKKVIFKNAFGFVFENPEINSPHVSDVVMGDVFRIIGKKNNFYNVKFPDGRSGFIPVSECADYNKWFNEKIVDVAEVLSRAQEFLGVPYLWGGTSVKGFDCSGFTKTIYFMSGLILPRDASQQVKIGVEVDTSNNFKKLQPGDLLFFGRKATDSLSEKVVHVALYLGGLKYIHASGKVKINSFDPASPLFNKYRYRTFLHARRILSSINKNGVVNIQKNKFYSGVKK